MPLNVVPTGATTATVILTQAEVDEVRGEPGMGRVPLAITFNGATYRTSISRYRGEWMMVVNAQMREGGLVPGGKYEADVVRDEAPRTVELPDDAAAAIQAAGLEAVWTSLAPSHQKECVRSIEDAKKPETRARRIESMINKLAT